MNILEKIVLRKKEEVAERKALKGIDDLKKMPLFSRPTYSLKDFILNPDKSGIICEFKKKSPSKGFINADAIAEEVTMAYTKAGASALSVLTDVDFFGGSDNDLVRARAVNEIPILRKDFIIDEYQIIEAKALGADVILLIAECLTKEEIFHLSAIAKTLKLSVLLETHSADQLEKINDNIDAIGVNNRNLKTFEVDIQTSLDLVNKIPNKFIKISESGISDPETIKILKKAGFQGFLIGENFMKTPNPGMACAAFIEKTKL